MPSDTHDRKVRQLVKELQSDGWKVQAEESAGNWMGKRYEQKDLFLGRDHLHGEETGYGNHLGWR